MSARAAFAPHLPAAPVGWPNEWTHFCTCAKTVSPLPTGSPWPG
ncbi:unnamed protein product [Protopolystoma xenopodis]|uniref:Uncharacterized protein n=1 Tax=Protopolystoma xenopodis TaxID=117903 RepID=A0A448XPN0_9PLAT|nr:unnamed protein product [Protopolystoma xenopodis]